MDQALFSPARGITEAYATYVQANVPGGFERQQILERSQLNARFLKRLW
ncbi:MAG: hypothetical protein MJA27_34860 [Pseudanabaenales cyanobacterium]|nr:hypothetical protein [Pseudanabaenales cyanobacterium]